MSKPIIKPYLWLATGITAVSFASILIRLAEAPSLVIAASRLTIASLILAPAAFIKSRGELRALTKADLGLAILSGLFLSLHFATWISSLEYTSVASSVVFVSTSPIFVGLASHFLLKERVSRQMFLGIAVSVLGGIIIGYGDFGLGTRELFGDLLALAGAVAVSGYLLIGRRLRPKLSLLSYIFLVYSTAAVSLIVLCLARGHPFAGYPTQTYLMFLLLAVVPQIIGHSSYNWALKYLPATFVGVGTLGEPVGSTILAYVILNEIPTLAKIGGGVLILAGIYISSRARSVVKVEGLKYILFDLDETLYPSRSGLMAAISGRMSRYMKERLGMPPDEVAALREHYYRTYGTTMRGLQIHHGIDPEDYLAYVHDVPLEDYIGPNHELDRVLAEIELEKVVFTNASKEHARRVLNVLGIERRFSGIIDVRVLGYTAKPDPRAYQRALEILGAEGKECLIVDDRVRNLTPAKELGMITVLVSNDETASQQAQSKDVDFVIGEVAEIGEVVRRLTSGF